MALADLDERRGRNLSRLPLIAGGHGPDLWKHGSRVDAPSGEQLLDILNLGDQSRYCGCGLTDRA